ncbi:hypothetical protein QQ045_017193 [Rhodiola kirilowii]
MTAVCSLNNESQQELLEAERSWFSLRRVAREVSMEVLDKSQPSYDRAKSGKTTKAALRRFLGVLGGA